MASPWAKGGSYASLAGFASTAGEKAQWGKLFRNARFEGGKSIKAAARVADNGILKARKSQQVAMKSGAMRKGQRHRPAGTPRGGQFY